MNNKPNDYSLQLPFKPWQCALSISVLMVASPFAMADGACNLADLAGRYIGLENGYLRAGATPAARLYQEDWGADGRISGTLRERQGARFRELAYTGQLVLSADCTGTLNRKLPAGLWKSSVVISPNARRAYTLDLAKGSTITGNLGPQTLTACSAGTLKGTVLSTQTGFSFVSGRWQPNAVIQREQHDGQGGLQGLAISSYAGKPEFATYSGQFQLKADCTGSLQETDSLGTHYDYRVIIDGAGKGYYYLQTDRKDLTGAYLGIAP